MNVSVFKVVRSDEKWLIGWLIVSILCTIYIIKKYISLFQMDDFCTSNADILNHWTTENCLLADACISQLSRHWNWFLHDTVWSCWTFFLASWWSSSLSLMRFRPYKPLEHYTNTTKKYWTANRLIVAIKTELSIFRQDNAYIRMLPKKKPRNRKFSRHARNFNEHYYHLFHCRKIYRIHSVQIRVIASVTQALTKYIAILSYKRMITQLLN